MSQPDSPLLPPAAAAVPATTTTGPIVVRADGPRRVAVLNTGGTIGMKPDAAGALAPCPGYLAERMLGMHEFARNDMPAVDLFELLPLLDSSDMGPDDWLRIAAEIAARYDAYDAFVVIMGTDTMAYAASALSFLLENLGKSVIVTGSMLPLAELINDAQRNLTVSLVVAATLSIPEVCIFINDRLLRGNRTVKVNSGGLDAFESPNYPPLARLETGIVFKPSAVLPPPAAPLALHVRLESNIAVWRMVPGFDDEYIQSAIRHRVGLRAIVLELYGTGNLSSRKTSLLAALRDAIGRGVVVVAASQCLRGTVDLRAYALGAHLERMGVVPALDTTIEAIVTKLAYLLSGPAMPLARLRVLMARSLRGEVTEEAAGGEAALPPRDERTAWGGGAGGVAAATAAVARGAAAWAGAASPPLPPLPPPSARRRRDESYDAAATEGPAAAAASPPLSASAAHGSGEVRFSMSQLSGSMRRLAYDAPVAVVAREHVPAPGGLPVVGTNLGVPIFGGAVGIAHSRQAAPTHPDAAIGRGGRTS